MPEDVTPPSASSTVGVRQERNKELMIEQLRKTPIVQVASEKIGISRATYYRWRKEDEAFTKDADQALEDGRLLMNDMAESQLLSAIRDKNMTGIIFWLKNRHPAYAPRLQVTAKTEQDEQLTPEQEETIREALRHASLLPPLHSNEPHTEEGSGNSGSDAEGTTST